MKEIVGKILKEEEAMRVSLEKARAEADALISRSRLQAQHMIEDISAEAKLEIQQEREQAQKEFQAEKEKVLSQTRSEAIELREKKTRDIPQLAQQIFSRIIEIKI